MWDKAQDGGQWPKKIRFHNLPEIIGQKKSQTAQIFWSMKIFSECPKLLGVMKTIFNIYKVPINIEQNKNSQNPK